MGGLLHGLLDTIVDGHFETIQQLDDAIQDLEDLLFADDRPPKGLQERVVVLKEGMLVMDAPKAQALNNSRMQQQQQAATGREWKNENQSA